MIVRTLQSEFPHYGVVTLLGGVDTVLLASNSPLVPNANDIASLQRIVSKRRPLRPISIPGSAGANYSGCCCRTINWARTSSTASCTVTTRLRSIPTCDYSSNSTHRCICSVKWNDARRPRRGCWLHRSEVDTAAGRDFWTPIPVGRVESDAGRLFYKQLTNPLLVRLLRWRRIGYGGEFVSTSSAG